MDRDNLIAKRELRRKLRIKLIVGLRIVGDQFDLLAEQTALAVDFVNCKVEASLLLGTEWLQKTRHILDGADANLVCGLRRGEAWQ